MFFEPFCKGSCRFSYIFFLTPIFTTFESVYDPTFVGNRIFVLGGHEEVFYGLTSFEVYRTNMKIHHIISLLRFCLNNSYFSFQGRFYQQREGAAMGSPISPIVAKLLIKDLEVQAIRTSPTPPSLWKRFVDDTFTIIKKEDRSSFLQHLNSIHQNIKFTCEEVRDDGSMPFLDILVTPKEDGSLSTSVFRKPTHTDLYLQQDSQHTISSKYSVAGTPVS